MLAESLFRVVQLLPHSPPWPVEAPVSMTSRACLLCAWITKAAARGSCSAREGGGRVKEGRILWRWKAGGLLPSIQHGNTREAPSGNRAIAVIPRMSSLCPSCFSFGFSGRKRCQGRKKTGSEAQEVLLTSLFHFLPCRTPTQWFVESCIMLHQHGSRLP